MHASRELCMLSTTEQLLTRIPACHSTCKAHNKQSSPIPVPSPDVRLVSLSLISQGTTTPRVVYYCRSLVYCLSCVLLRIRDVAQIIVQTHMTPLLLRGVSNSMHTRFAALDRSVSSCVRIDGEYTAETVVRRRPSVKHTVEGEQRSRLH